jgi:hypothetical protein
MSDTDWFSTSTRGFRRRAFGRFALTAATVAACALAIGCDRPAPRAAVHGRVMFDGQPLEYGYVEFRPEPNNPGPAAAVEIRRGSFELPAEQGPGAGAVRVRLHGRQPPSIELDDPVAVAAADDEVAAGLDVELLPDRYHERSEIVETLVADRPNELTYQLESEQP